YRENNTRMIDWMSVMVPTVDRELPPIGFWSTTTAGAKLSIDSASGPVGGGRPPRFPVSPPPRRRSPLV
ncbi:hypothetical protein, partial [Nocardia abscessus]|uniref:hypothetical protein n=1 Tax=Nocardia abscessus TaxID=120957 RepID=UPI00245595D6